MLAVSSGVIAQTLGEKEEFTAVAIANNNIQSGAGTVLISIDRWSTSAERDKLVSTLVNKGPRALLDALQDTRPVGRIRTPDSLGYDLHYAFQTPGEDGGRRIVIATDRPIGFWEAYNQPRTVDYPFTIVEMHIGAGRTRHRHAVRIHQGAGLREQYLSGKFCQRPGDADGNPGKKGPRLIQTNG